MNWHWNLLIISTFHVFVLISSSDYLSFRTKTDIVRLKDFLPNGLYSASPLSSKKPLGIVILIFKVNNSVH